MAPLEPVQLRPILEEETAFAVRFVGAAGVPPPRKMPERTALAPPALVTEIVTEPPAGTLIGALTQAPWLKSVEMSADRAPEPSLMVIVSRRELVSQSKA